MRSVGGYLLGAVGCFMGVGVLLNSGGPHSAAALLLAFAVFALAPLGAGAWLLKGFGARREARRVAECAWDSELLRLAARRDGSLSVAEVVAHADLAPAQAEQRLDALHRRGLCELRVTEEGVLVYRFVPTPSVTHKLAAEGVLDE